MNIFNVITEDVVWKYRTKTKPTLQSEEIEFIAEINTVEYFIDY